MASFGEILRDARESRGMDILSAARRVRIRPDILEAIEATNFENMPPRGYARNMINAYARLLGLNPTEMVRLYLEELQVHQTSALRTQGASTFSINQPTTRAQRRLDANTIGVGGRAARRGDAFSDYDRSEITASDSEITDFETKRPRPTNRTQRLDAKTEMLSQTLQSSHTFSPRRGIDMPTHSVTNMYQSSLSNVVEKVISNRQYVIAGLAVILILIILLLVINSIGSHDSKENASQETIAVTGVADSSAGVGSATSSITQDVAKEATTIDVPAFTEIKVNVADGVETYIEIYEGGEYGDEDATCVVADKVKGPFEKTFKVDTMLEVVLVELDGVTVVQDGEVVQFDDSSSGVYTKTFNFKEILDAWKKEHGIEESDVSVSSSKTEGSKDLQTTTSVAVTTADE